MVCIFDKNSLTTYKADAVRIEGVPATSDKRDPKTKLYPLTLLRKKGETVYDSTTTLSTLIVQPSRAYAAYVQPMWGELPEYIPGDLENLPQALLAKVYVRPGLDEIDRYHAKFGDVGIKYLKRCVPSLKIPTQYRCEICIDGKMHKFGHRACPEGVRVEYEPGVCIHSDHSGPYAKSLSGARYSQLYLDRGSGYLWAARQKKKTGHYESTPKIFVDAWGLSGKHVQVFQTDGDGVFTSTQTRDMLEEEKVRHEYSAPYDSNTNAFIERARRTIFEGVSTALIRSGAPARFWGEAENHKIYTLNVTHPRRPSLFRREEILFSKKLITRK